MQMEKKVLNQKEEQNYPEYRIRRKTFYAITIMMLVLFVFFQVTGNTSLFQYTNPAEILEEGMSKDYLKQLVEAMKNANNYESETEPEYLVISSTFDKMNMEVSSVLETLEGMKLPHQCVSLEEAKKLEIASLPETVETVIICGDVSGTAVTRAQLNAFIERGVNIVYTQMPTADAIVQNDLADILGIYKMNGMIDQEGMRFIDEVFWGGNLDLEDLEYSLEDVQLQSSCKIYGYGLKGRDSETVETNEQLPPLMWRNTIKGSKVFVVNGKFFEENKGYGILVAIISDIYEDLIYPIVNASVMIYDSIPYDGVANEELMMELYARDSIKFQTSILLPDIISICKRLDVVPSFYTSADTKLPEMDYFERSILELGGELIYSETAQVSVIDISNPEGRIWDQYPNLPVIVSGFRKNDDDMTKLYSIGSTFGIVVHRVDVSKIINANSKDVNWVTVSRDYSDYIAYYNEDFGNLEYMTASEAAIRYMEYMLLSPKIHYSDDIIDVQIENMPQKASFVLRTEKKIKEVENGQFTEIYEDIYLIETTSKELTIHLKEDPDSHYQGGFFKTKK